MTHDIMPLCECFLAIGITTALGLIISGWLFLDKRRRFWEQRNFPCTGRALMLFGDYKEASRTEHLQETNRRLYREFKARKLPIGGTILYVVQSAIVVDPELIKAILVKDFSNFHSRGLYHNPEVDPLSGSLFFLEGQAWRQLRAKLTPTFTSGKMKMMFETILGVADELGDYFRDKTSDGTVELEMKDVMSAFTVDVIGTCAFGIECNSLRDGNNEIREVSRKIFKQSTLHMLWVIFLTMFKGLATKLRLKETPADLEKFYMDLVRNTVEYREKNSVQRNDFMNLLIQLKNSENPDERVTMNEITAQAFLFFVAGFESSSTTMVNCLYELAMNPDVQEKLRAEIKRVCGDGKLTYEMVSSVEYLNMVIDETLRKYPVADFLMRMTANDYKIEGSDLTIPEKTMLIIPTYAIQHDEEYYPDPERFDPERFNAKNRSARHPYVYLPFGEGPRNCIGSRFGQMQTRVGLITVLRKFLLKPGPNTPARLEVDPNAGLAVPKGGVLLQVDKI